jgi:magnesium-transporting ATPase (P-type)
VILYEVNESASKIETEIAKILELSRNKGDQKLELLIDGGVFAKMLMAKKDTLKEMNTAFNSASAIIIYRASPKQKEQVVQFVRTHNPGKVTLSVGDGSNDVNMI